MVGDNGDLDSFHVNCMRVFAFRCVTLNAPGIGNAIELETAPMGFGMAFNPFAAVATVGETLRFGRTAKQIFICSFRIYRSYIFRLIG